MLAQIYMLIFQKVVSKTSKNMIMLWQYSKPHQLNSLENRPFHDGTALPIQKLPAISAEILEMDAGMAGDVSQVSPNVHPRFT